MRLGLFATKIGMTRIFSEDGSHNAVTVLKCDDAVVTKVSEYDDKKYVQLGVLGEVNKKSLNKPQLSSYAKLKIAPRKKSAEFKVDSGSKFEVGQTIYPCKHFVSGQFVDIQGVSSGKGFAGGMKRHGFAGLEATHGVSISHRSHGSTGQCQDPGKVFKGKKMAGHMGNETVTVQNLEIIGISEEDSLFFIKGSIPGRMGSVVRIKDAVKKSIPVDAPYPTYIKQDVQENPDKDSDVSEEGNN